MSKMRSTIVREESLAGFTKALRIRAVYPSW